MSGSSPPTHPQTEFDAQQNRLLGELAANMQWVAMPLILIGIMYAVVAVSGIVEAFRKPEILVTVLFLALAMLFYLALGIWTQRAADAFRKVATTTGSDITHLMEALENLRKKYSLLSLLVKIYVVFAIIGLVIILVMMFTGMGKG